jgi:excisionase family DNA binding protein
MSEVADKSPLLHTRNEAVALLRISVRTLDRLIADGQLAVCKIGSRVLIADQEIARFVKRISESGRRKRPAL